MYLSSHRHTSFYFQRIYKTDFHQNALIRMPKVPKLTHGQCHIYIGLLIPERKPRISNNNNNNTKDNVYGAAMSSW